MAFDFFDPDNFYSDEEDDFTGFSPTAYGMDDSQGLRNISARPSQGDQILQEYLNSQPNPEDFSPSIWRKLGGTLLGALSKNPAETAFNFTNRPYLEAQRQFREERPIVQARANQAEKQANREFQAEKFGAQENTRRRQKESALEKQQLQNSMRAEERAMQQSRLAEKDRMQLEHQRLADERASRAEKRSQGAESRAIAAEKRAQEFHGKRMKDKPTKEFEYKDSPATALRETKADEELHNMARQNVVENPMFSDYFDITGDKVSMKPDLPPHLVHALHKAIADEYETLFRRGRKTLPRREVNFEDDNE